MPVKKIAFIVASVALPAFPPLSGAEQPLPPAEQWLSPESVIAVKVSRPRILLDLLFREAFVDAVASSEAYKNWAAGPDARKVHNLVRFIERRFQTDWRTFIRRMTGGGVTLSVGPGNTVIVAVDALDTDLPGRLHDMLVNMAAGGPRGRRAGQGRVRSKTVGDTTLWSVGPNEAHAIIGRRLLFSNSQAAIEAALRRRAKGEACLADLPAYREAVDAAGKDAAFRVYLNFAAVRQMPQVAGALTAAGNPLVAVLAAPVTEALGMSTWMSLAGTIDEDAVELDVCADGTIDADGAARFALPDTKGTGAMPNLRVPRRIAAASLYRDLRGFYAAKDELFPERTSGLIFFENMMGIYFSGRDLTDEILAEIGPEIRMVVAEQEYDTKTGTPAVKIPAFAVVMRLKNPDRFALVVEEAWQKAVGMINFTRGQQALPGLIIDRPVHRDTKYTLAAFNAHEAVDREALDVRFNFRPALAMPGNHLILSSTDGLAEDLIDALEKERDTAAASGTTHSLVEIDGRRLRSILRANRQGLVRQNMVEEGNTLAEAEAAIDTLLSLVGYVRGATLKLGTVEGRSRMSLRIPLNMPAGRQEAE